MDKRETREGFGYVEQFADGIEMSEDSASDGER